MLRQIIQIDESKCNGCGLCATACHEGAIGIVDGKAKLLRDDYCDGMGDCLPACPTDAISFVEREAAAYDEAAVAANKAAAQAKVATAATAATAAGHAEHIGGCPGSRATNISHVETASASEASIPVSNMLSNWPVQIKLAPTNAPYFEGCNLLIAADCTAYARGDFHARFIDGRVTLIGCPKLDAIDYSDKLAELFANNNINSIVLTRMVVPCCGGLVHMVQTALQKCGKDIPLQVVTIDLNGEIVE